MLGLYYLSIVMDKEPGEGRIFGSMAEIEHALAAGTVTLQAKVKGRYRGVDENGNPFAKVYDTTPGRLILAEHLPKMPGISFDLVNRLLTKKNIGRVIDAVYRTCGQKETVMFCDRIMAFGFHHAYKAGISFGKDDMLVPETKKKIIADTEALVLDYEQQYNDGLITQMEKYNKVVDTWAKCTDRIAKEMMDRISAVQHDKETGREKPINSVYMMAHSGARGSEKQMRQLAGMRGLMAKPSGEIIETPIISNFKEGLSVLEYFNSTHGARKGLADTALKTANSGYLTRRLVDVAQDCIVTAEDCGTDKGIKLGAVIDSGEVLVSVGDRVLGRVPGRRRDPPVHGQGRRQGWRSHRRGPGPGHRGGAGSGGSHPLGADLRAEERHLRQVLRPRPRARHAGQYRRGRGRDRRAVHRRAGHPAHHAHLPHRRHGAGCRQFVR